jgi:adenosylmethionine-8-amino-7-oxononanoate aminotransferase
MKPLINDWLANDLAHNWHPFMQMKDFETYPPKRIIRSEGIRLFSEDTWYYDTISSWWCNILGHRHPALVQAMVDQLDRLDHIMFGNFTHDGAIELSKKLVEITPNGLNHVYYSDNGSTAIEVAIKMSLNYWHNLNQSKKTAMVSFSGSYHGDTIGAMSVSGVAQFNSVFKPLMTPSICLPNPSNNESAAIQALHDYLKTHADQVAAVVVEPLLMGAGGMQVTTPNFFKEVRQLTQQFNVHLISDEVATGFGRLGSMFASQMANVTPDFLCLSKALTNGQLPLAVTLLTSDIYHAFYADFDDNKTFYHGHTFTANPLGCAVANETLAVLDSIDWTSNVNHLHVKLSAEFHELCDRFRFLSNPRAIGAVAAVDVSSNTHRALFKLSQLAFDYHLTIRPIGQSIYLYLPIVTTSEECDDILDRLNQCLTYAEQMILF